MGDCGHRGWHRVVELEERGTKSSAGSHGERQG